MNQPPGRPADPSSFQVAISSLTLGTLYEAVLAFASQDRLETFWPSVCQNARWLIPSRRMAILLSSDDGNFEINGLFEQGKFHKPLNTRVAPDTDLLRRALTHTGAQWITKPWQQLEQESGSFAQWFLHDRPELLFVLPIRVKGKTMGALLFAMSAIAATDQAMLNTLGTIYTLHVGMTYTLLRVTEERQQMQNQLMMQEKMASLGSLVAGIAHEMNNPVGAVQSAADVVTRCVNRIEGIFEDEQALQDAPGSVRTSKEFAAIKDNSGVIVEAGARIAEMVKSLRNFARPDEADFQRAGIHEGIDSTLTLLHNEFKDRITVVKEYGEIPEIYCSPGQLNQVFMSLLKNAGESIEGFGTIRIKTMRNGDQLSIQISDSGKGIPPERLKSIFDFEFSETGSRVRMRSGLATAYNIIQRHRGQIRVDSTFGAGTSFTIMLPIEGELTANSG